MAKKLTRKEVAENYGCEDFMELLEEYIHESTVPSMCEEGCMVEPDGKCSHGHESIFLEIGIL